MKILPIRSIWQALLFSLIPVLSAAQEPMQADTAKVRSYLALSDKYYYADQLDSAEFYCIKAGELARSLNYKRGIADYISYIIPVWNRQGRYQEALDLALEGLEVSREIGDNSLLAIAYNNAGNQYQYLGNLKSSATHYLNALIFSENADTPQRRMRYSNNLASVFLQLEEKSKSFYYAKKSYDLAFDTGDSLGMASSLVNLASSEILNEKFDDAIRHLDQVLAIGEAVHDNSYVLDALINKADAYSKMKNYRKALSLYERSSQVLKNYQVPDYELYIYWGLAQNNFHLGNYSRAEEYLSKAIKVAEQLEALQELTKLYLLGSEVQEKMQDNATALSFRKRYEFLNDSLSGADTRRNIHQLEIEYQTAQKEKAIADQRLIIAQNNLVIERKDKSILLWTTVALLLLSAIIIFTLVYRNKQKTNAQRLRLLKKQSEVQVLNALIDGEEKERVRLARELHDGVGGILSASKMHLSMLHEENTSDRLGHRLQKISSMLDQASQEIRTIAHNLYADALQMNDLQGAISSYCDRIKSEGLNIQCYFLGQLPPFDNRFKLILYRAIQELLNNVMKHAHAHKVLVQVSCHDNILNITVEDDGIGFVNDGRQGMGLRNLGEKLRNLEGRMTVESSPGHGTTIQLEFDTSRVGEHSPAETLTANA